MRVLVVLSHPDPNSLTHAVAGRLAAGVSAAAPDAVVETADLSAEGFDPRYVAADVAHFQRRAPAPADVLAEQARIDRADALALIYPVYWWAMPGLLKGWIDRVFTGGWAYEEKPDGGVDKRLGRLPVHLVGVGGAGDALYRGHGYDVAMRTQIDHGVFGYCGAPVASSTFLLPSDEGFPASALTRAEALGRTIAEPALAAP